MVKELCFSVISDVLDSWEALRRIPDYEVTAGRFLFERLFERCPEAMPLFGFPKSVEMSEILESKRFRRHAQYLVQMFDSTMNMLGPDTELLTEIMASLGKKHVRYGVKPDMFPAMGEALMYSLEKCLKSQSYEFNERVRLSWQEVYGTLVQDMIKAMEEELS